MPGKTKKMTPNQVLVLDALQSNSGPLSAYQVMDCLKDKGITAPPTVYRALTQLISRGVVHRIDSLNAYIACDHSSAEDAPHDSEAAFAICQDCGEVAELEVGSEMKRFEKVMDNVGFALSQAKVELIGTCQSCQSEAPNRK